MNDPTPLASIEELARLPLFAGESPGLLAWLQDRCEVRCAPPATVLLSPQQTNRCLYVILDGLVRIQLDQQAVLAYLEPGHCIGEMSVIEGAPPSATAVTHSECRLLAINGDTLDMLMARSPTVTRNLLSVLSARLRHDNLVIVEGLQRQQAFERDSLLDELTGLLNRRWMEEKLPALWRRNLADSRPIAVLMIDVDKFKQFNDSHGHPAGDRALATIATVLGNQLRERDAAIRYGGEEFMVVMPDTDSAEAYAIAERLRHAVQQAPITRTDGSPLPHVTISVGLASGHAERDALLAAADAALYRAKHGGRNRVCS